MLDFSLSLFFFFFAALHQTCVPEMDIDNPWIDMRDMLTGCWSSFVMGNQTEVHILSLIFDSTVSMSGFLRCVKAVCMCVCMHLKPRKHDTRCLWRVPVWINFHFLCTAASSVRLHAICYRSTVSQSQAWRPVWVTVTKQRFFCLSAVTKSIYQKSDLRWLERRRGLNMTDSSLLTNS